ncbi:MAG: hypothetical protein SAK29_03820 [Scytonema sp. PMC 1069.18]|nr:hypothetical protein [Scytonema sp. PMC 1069.18]MEC4881445.1 hypothetical protein [Scytonema sp. PMC 1070.18]
MNKLTGFDGLNNNLIVQLQDNSTGSMRIKIVTLESPGGTRAYVAIGLGLQRAGHSVQLATVSSLQQFVSSWGLDFAPVDCNNFKRSSKGSRSLSQTFTIQLATTQCPS